MSISRAFHYLCITLVCLASVPVEAKDVTLQYRGLRLNARLELAKDKTLAEGVILITHGGLAHYGMETIANLQGLLKDAGYNTLAINLGLGLDNRHGMYDCNVTHRHRHHDAVDEIDAWLAWLKGRRARHVVLLGHSRGGGQTALHAVERDNALVKAVVLMAPQTGANGGAGYRRRYGQPLKPVLETAQALIRQGRGDAVLQHANMLFCRDTRVTADAFVSYYGPDPRLDTPYLLPKIKKPTLVLVAEEDEVVPDLDKKIASLPDRGQARMKVISGAGHFFRDLSADDAVDAIDIFLSTIPNH